ncbi:hypothetical protein [Bacillus bingmayongensis]|uniref:hypothetical protein n=1 Tax=Bacillus bingmayongensis TaxID=1150157 RepID=UPI0002F3F5D8|nr:hypothetical protein [Bacillus bingmayongensis]MBY0597756.1 hypothetical protein [Bacillus bingmayongensis]
MRKKRKRLIIITLLFAMYITLHSIPNVAVRTAIFLSGHPIIALHGEVQKRPNPYQEAIPESLRVIYSEQKADYDVYYFSSPYAKEKGRDWGSAYVKKVWFMYNVELEKL